MDSAVPVKPVSLEALSPETIDSVVELHLRALPYSINSMLGAHHLAAIYKRMSEDAESIVVVATADESVAGVVSATLDPRRLKQLLISETSPVEKLALFSRMLFRPAILVEWFRGQFHSRRVTHKGVVVEAFLTAIAVADNSRRAGIGSLLVDAVSRFVLERGKRAYYLETRAANTASRSFYAKLGFIESEKRGRDIVLVKEVTQ